MVASLLLARGVPVQAALPGCPEGWAEHIAAGSCFRQLPSRVWGIRTNRPRPLPLGQAFQLLILYWDLGLCWGASSRVTWPGECWDYRVRWEQQMVLR